MEILKPALAATVLLAAAPAFAHVSVQPQSATAGGYQVLRFGVGHGCDGAATTAVRIIVPKAISTARPQPKPGWELTIERDASAPERPSAIVWRGRLPADQYEEFLMLVKLPAQPERLAFPALQSCGSATVGWDQPTEAGAPRPSHPAPVVTLTPADPPPSGGHDHR